MKYSQLFGKTIKNSPASASLASHKLLYQAGFIRELVSGRYEMLPLGARVYQKIIAVIEEEMQKLGSQRVFTPTLHPKELWQKTGRVDAWGKDLLQVKDERTKQEFALAATGEGLFTEMVKDMKPSYRDLPIVIHQFSQKFRNEKRPRGGLLRLREFLMKDAYSFDEDVEKFKKNYELFYQAYLSIAKKLGLDPVPVIADNGALGGDYSHEFMVEGEFGEDTIVRCDKCDYAANLEKAEFIRREVNGDEEIKPYEEVALPLEVKTIKNLVAHYNLPPERFIKNVVYKTGDNKIIIATITGDLDVNEKKLARVVGSEDLEPATDEDLASFGAKPGFVHSWGYSDPRITFVVDQSVVNARNLYGGRKTDTTDPINVNYGRDFQSHLVADLASAPEGAICAKCGKGHLKLVRAIEFGHIFSYGYFYSEPHGATFVDREGKEKLLYMGSYGIGVERAMAIVVEKLHDEKGIVWPEAIAPFQYHLIVLGESEAVQKQAQEVYEKLQELGKEVLFDDRDVSAGQKFADADLIGIPWRLVVSEKSAGKIEVKRRTEKESKLSSLEDFKQ
jgi:prolyl-tRNA synthetase